MIRAVVAMGLAACANPSGMEIPDAPHAEPDAPDAPIPPPSPSFAQAAYIKSIHPVHDAHFGQPAMSAAGDTLVATQFGTVSVYTRDGTWRAAGELIPTSTAAGSDFGSHVAISSDGTTIAVGGSRAVNTVPLGSVYIFRRSGDTWLEDGRIDDLTDSGSQNFSFDEFPASMAVSRDGTLLVVGSRGDNDIGRVRTYRRLQDGWSKVSSLGGDSDDFHFGLALALSSDGSMLAAHVQRAPMYDSAVELFERAGDGWVKRTALVSPDSRPESMFGMSVSCSSQCQTLVVGDVQPPPMMPPGDPGGAGAAYVFEREGATWTHTASLAASNADLGDRFGFAVAVSDDGSTIVAGASAEGSASTGINGASDNNAALYSGAAYVFRRFQGAWWQLMYLKASNAETIDIFGYQVAINNNGETIAVAAPYEPSSASGVGGDQSDNSLPYAGAVYIFEGTY